MEEKRTLIETFLPVEEISAEAKIEKNGRAPTFELHYWWTRKPLVAARATVLGSLLPEDYDVTEFKHLLGLRDNQKKRAHNYDLSRSEYENIKNEYLDLWGTETPTVLDPFGGGGSIPFEAVRMGCNVISNDYNPLAFLIQKATIEYPANFGTKLLNDVENGLNWVFERTKKELEHLYPKYNGKDVTTYIYSWVVTCPDCGFKNPLINQWWLVKKNKNLFLNPSIDNDKFKLEIKKGNKSPPGTVIMGKGNCMNNDCGKTIPNDHIVNYIEQNEEEKLLAMVLHDKGYVLPREEDFEAINESKKLLDINWDIYLKENLIPLDLMPIGDIRIAKYLKRWYRILNPRQRVLFSTLIKNIRLYINEIKHEDEEYLKAIETYLSFILGKHINRNCLATKYDRDYEKISGTTSYRRPSIQWDHTEVNPFSDSSGSLVSVKKSILKSIEYSIEKLNDKKDILIENFSITELDHNVPLIITDPPYFDDVQYAELSELFYVFEQKVFCHLNNLPETIPKSEDLSVGRQRKKELFKELFDVSCQKMHSMLTVNGILVMYFAHSSVEAWDFVVNSLQHTGFRITATWPIHTENPNNPIARGNASIMSSIIIVARKRTNNKSGYIEEIKEDLHYHLQSRLNEFWNYGLRGADITVAAMGATLNILTQYSEIKSYTGEMSVKDILELVEVYVVEYILAKFLKNSESLDSPTRFYTYCRLSQLNGMSFDTANLISKSLHIDLKLLESAGIIDSIMTGRNKGIKLLKFDERENIEVKTLIDAVHFSMSSYEKGGMRDFESVLKDIPYTKGEIYNILESFKHLESGDSEKQIAMQILGKSLDKIPERGQSTLDDKLF